MISESDFFASLSYIIHSTHCKRTLSATVSEENQPQINIFAFWISSFFQTPMLSKIYSNKDTSCRDAVVFVALSHGRFLSLMDFAYQVRLETDIYGKFSRCKEGSNGPTTDILLCFFSDRKPMFRCKHIQKVSFTIHYKYTVQLVQV